MRGCATVPNGEPQGPGGRSPQVGEEIAALLRRYIELMAQTSPPDRGCCLAILLRYPGVLVSATVLERDRLQSEVHAPEPGYAPHPSRELIRYTEGTVMLYFVDARTGNVVWRAAATRELDDPFLRSAQAGEAVHRLFAAYPARAGG